MSQNSATTFLSSPFVTKKFAPNPSTERGVPLVINSHPKENKIVYPSGKYIVVRNLDDPNDCFIYRGHANPTTVAKWSPNGFWIASGDSAGKIKIWSWDNPEHLLKIEVPVFSGPVQDLDWDDEAKKIVAVGEGGQMNAKVFTWDTGNSVGELVGINKKALSVAYRKERPFKIMTGSMDFGTCFYAGPPFKLDHSNPTVHSNFVNCVRYSSDSNTIVSVSSDKKIQLYDGTTGQPTRDIPNAHAGSIYSFAFSPDNSKIVTASGDKTLKIWNLATLACEKTLQTADTIDVADMQHAVVWTAAGIVSVSLNGDLNIFKTMDVTRPTTVIKGHQVSVSSLFVDARAGRIYSGSNDGVVIVRDVSATLPHKVASQNKKSVNDAAHGGKVTGLLVSGEQLISSGFDDSLRFADLSTRAYVDSIATNGQPIALAGGDVPGVYAIVTTTEIAVYRQRQKIASLAKLPYSGTCITLLGDREVAVGGDDSKTHVYTVANGTLTEARTIPTRTPVSSVAYSPTGDYLAIGDNGRQVEVYERATWTAKIQGIWVFHTSKVTALSWSPNGSKLASGSLDENIFIWDLTKPQERVQFQFSHMTGVTGLGWLDAATLVSSGNDQTVLTWKVAVE